MQWLYLCHAVRQGKLNCAVKLVEAKLLGLACSNNERSARKSRIEIQNVVKFYLAQCCTLQRVKYSAGRPLHTYGRFFTLLRSHGPRPARTAATARDYVSTLVNALLNYAECAKVARLRPEGAGRVSSPQFP